MAFPQVFCRNVTMLFGSLIFMFSLSWRLSVVTFIAVPIIFLISKVFGVYYDVSILYSFTDNHVDCRKSRKTAKTVWPRRTMWLRRC